MAKFQNGQHVFIIESAIFVKEVVVVKYSGGFYLIKYPDSTGGFKVRESRLYATKQEAELNSKKKEVRGRRF